MTCCPNCGSNKIIKLYSRRIDLSNKYDNFLFHEVFDEPEQNFYSKLFLCKRCTFVFYGYRYSASELSKLYSEDYSQKRSKYISAFEKTSFKQDGITALARHRRKSMVLNEYLKLRCWHDGVTNILDIGGWSGENIPNISLYTNKYVQDKSNHQIKEPGVRSYNDSVDSIMFDMVMATHVIEHVTKPDEFLCNLAEKLDDSGLVYIEFPFDIVGLFRKPSMYEHINFYSGYSICKALNLAGLACTSASIKKYLYSYHPTIAYVVTAEKKIKNKKYAFQERSKWLFIVSDIIKYLIARLDRRSVVIEKESTAFLSNS